MISLAVAQAKYMHIKGATMLFNTLLLAENAADATKKNDDKAWIMWVIIGVVLVLMIVLTIVPQKKRQKEQQKMMNSLNVGTKLMTVGGIVGKITQVNTDNTLIINVGTENSPTLIVIDKKAVGYVLEGVAMPAAPVAEEQPAVQETPAVEEEPFEETTDVAEVEEAEETEVNEAEEDEAEETEPAADLDDPFGKSRKKSKK